MKGIEKKETRDEVIHEVWNIKESLAREDGFDVRRIVRKSREKQNQGESDHSSDNSQTARVMVSLEAQFNPDNSKMKNRVDA